MICLSHYLNESTPGYGGSKTDVQIKPLSCMEHGDSCNALTITFKNHVGTHIDLPKHFDPNGKTLKDYSDNFWRFNSPQILDLPCGPGQLIDVSDLEGKVNSNADCLLIRTGFETLRQDDVYWSNNPGINVNVGPWLRETFPNLRLVGFDFISLTSYTNRPLGREAHKGFLGPLAGHEPIVILEDLKLSVLKNALQTLIVAPLWCDSVDGCPVTVFSF